ncbi:hypothetical protein ACFQ2Y_14000 [Streptomyces malaysiensis subsp. malaysiensis]
MPITVKAYRRGGRSWPLASAGTVAAAAARAAPALVAAVRPRNFRRLSGMADLP